MEHSLLSPSSSSFLSITNHLFDFRIPTPSPLFSFRNSNISKNRRLVFSPSISERNLQGSWFPPERDTDTNDDCGGWAIVESQIEQNKNKGLFSGVGLFWMLNIPLVAAIAYISMTRTGFKFRFNAPLHALQRMLVSSDTSANGSGNEDSNASDSIAYEATPENISDVNVSASSEKLKSIIISIAADSTQQEAVQILKKLKIIEDDVQVDELCTRREYARWLVKLNSMLERNQMHHLVPSMLLSGCVAQAFDDISIEDPDFWYIQALAESGIIPSKLSNESSYFPGHSGLKGEELVNFFPESFISRLDLVNWKAQLEYSSMPGIKEKISMKELGYMDVMLSLDDSSGLLMDLLAGDKSIQRKVFGNSRRFQPRKPATTAQAAVALTAGKMTEAIYTELLRLEAENLARLSEMEEIRSELLLRGDIQRVWEEKLNEVKSNGQEAARHYNTVLHDLEQAKNDRDKNITEILKEEAALDCQRQLLLSLKEEVNEMSERLPHEKASFAAEQKSSEEMSIDLQVKQEAITEAKSILEAEKEALQILRTWIEDEAKRSQARAQVLEEVGRRWKWNDEA